MATRKKKTFGERESIEESRNDLLEPYDSDSADEAKSIKDLSPDSIEFKKRINNENYHHFIELSEIYSQEMLASQQFLQTEMEKQAFLEKYYDELEHAKEIFQKLITHGAGPEQTLQAVQLERLQRVEVRVDKGIELINTELQFWETVLEKLDSDIATFELAKQHKQTEAGNVLQNYAASIASSDVFIRTSIALTLTPEEKEKLGTQSWMGEIKLDVKDFQIIANRFAAKVGRGEVSYLDQAAHMKAEVENHLNQKIKHAGSFLTGEQQTHFIERNMNSSQAKNAVHQAAGMIAQHFGEQDAKHGNKLKLIAVSVGEIDAKLNAAMQQREKAIDIVKALEEQRKGLQATQASLLEARQNKSTSLDLSSEIKNAQSALSRLAERMVLVDKAHNEFGQDKEKEADETLSVRPKAF